MIDFILRIFTSLKLTVVCLGLSMVLVFMGTMAQVDLGIHAAQQKYFESLFVYWTPANSDWRIPVFPGGHLIGGVLFLNLIVTHFHRFKFEWKKSGIILLHFGVFLLLLGGFLTERLSVESQMRIHEGDTKNYSESLDAIEFIVVNTSAPDFEEVVAIPDRYLAPNMVIQRPEIPFRVKVVDFFPNSLLKSHENHEGGSATEGFGKTLAVSGIPRATKMNDADVPSVVVEIAGVDGSLGTWLCSTAFEDRQTFRYQDKTYALQLRQKRYYKPYSIKLIDFAHDRYDGTDIPKNFSSKIRLLNSEKREDREVLIYMNNPLRYEGETYYQAGFEKDDRTTVLQVVHNPSWITPYLACSLVALGLVVQFSMHLLQFAGRKKA